MEISKLSSGKQTVHTSSISSKKIGKDFSQEFDTATKREKEKQLSKLLDYIKKKGKQVIETKSITAVHEYKNYIKEYLSLILEDAYRVDKIQSLYGGPSALVSIINDELNNLAQSVLTQEKDNISVVNKIESIEGLLVDIYK